MASQKSPKNGSYLIFHPEKLRFLDIINVLIFRRSLASLSCVENNCDEFVSGGGIHADGVTLLILVIQKFLAEVRIPLKWFGIALEFLLNLFSLNGGLIGLLRNFIQGKLIIPDREAANFTTMIGYMDGRVNLYESNSLLQYYPLMDLNDKLNQSDLNILDLAIMASKTAYENAAHVENIVTNIWKMKFVKFYSCWNKYIGENGTQAFIFCDKSEDANLIVLAFRGTEAFNARDWSTDVDLSWLSMGKLGFVHLGFLKALGIQDDKDYQKGFPKDYIGTDILAYYTLRAELKSLKKQHPNANILVTGHSLGGALAAIFPALLSLHGQFDLLFSLHVLTFGQPRVGDAIFATYLQTLLLNKFYRGVYRYDIVPRIPFDWPPIALFKHGGPCIYFNGWYEAQIIIEAPNPNYFSLQYILKVYGTAWSDFFKALVISRKEGEDFKEGIVSILYRLIFNILLPGATFHSPRDYVNGVRLAKTKIKYIV